MEEIEMEEVEMEEVEMEEEETRGVCVPRGFSQSSTAIDTVGLFVRRRKVFTHLAAKSTLWTNVFEEIERKKEKVFFS